MTYFLAVIAFILIFSLLVLIHEFGHFLMAKRSGVKVEEFGLGFPPRLKKLFKKGETTYTLNWIPFGGFVRMLGEDTRDEVLIRYEEKKEYVSKKEAQEITKRLDVLKKKYTVTDLIHDPKSFQSKTLWQRTQIIIAGVTMNFLLALILFTIGFSVGLSPLTVSSEELSKYTSDQLGSMQAVVTEVVKNSAAEKAGFQFLDRIKEINGQTLTSLNDVKKFQISGQANSYEVLRNGDVITITATPEGDQTIGILITDEYKLYLPPHTAFYVALKECLNISAITVKMLGKVIISLVAKLTIPEGVAGPVGIAQLTYYSVKIGFLALIQLCAVLSLSLAVINVMPFPALDGGRLLFVGYEIIFRKRANQKIETTLHIIGFLLLIGLLIAVTFKDIVRLIETLF